MKVLAITFVLLVLSPFSAPFHPLDSICDSAEIATASRSGAIRDQLVDPSTTVLTLAAADIQFLAERAGAGLSSPIVFFHVPKAIGDYVPLTTILRL